MEVNYNPFKPWGGGGGGGEGGGGGGLTPSEVAALIRIHDLSNSSHDNMQRAFAQAIAEERAERQAADSTLSTRLSAVEGLTETATWGVIQGNLEDQEDLQDALDEKVFLSEFVGLENDFTAHQGNSEIHITGLERVAWEAKPTVEEVESKIAAAAIRTFNTDDDWEVPTRSYLNGFILPNNTAYDNINNREINNFDVYLVLDSQLQFYFDSGAWILFQADFAKYLTRQEAADTFASKLGLNTHVADSEIHVTTAEKEAWGGAVTGLGAHLANVVKHITAEERAAWNALLVNPMDVVGLSLNSKIAGENQGLTITLAGELEFPCRLQLLRKGKKHRGFIGNLTRAGGANLQGFQVSGWWWRAVSVTAESVFGGTVNGMVIPAGSRQIGLTGQQVLDMFIPPIKRGIKHQDWETAWTEKPENPITKYAQGVVGNIFTEGLIIDNALPLGLRGDILVDINVPLGGSNFVVSGVITVGATQAQVGANTYFSTGSMSNTQPVVLGANWSTGQLRLFPLSPMVGTSYENSGRPLISVKCMPLRHIRPRHNAAFSKQFMPTLGPSSNANRDSKVELRFRLIRLVPVGDGKNKAIIGKASEEVLKIHKHASTHDGLTGTAGSARRQMTMELY